MNADWPTIWSTFENWHKDTAYASWGPQKAQMEIVIGNHLENPVNWDIIWQQFVEWFRQGEKINGYKYPWRAQKYKIEKLVEEQLCGGG